MLTLFGVAALTFMMLMYALERRGQRYILAFACGCLLSSAYGFLAGAWPFGVVELIWVGIALHRYRRGEVVRGILRTKSKRARHFCDHPLAVGSS